YLYIDGRRTDLVISGGMNVYPAEVEGVLLGFAGVQDAAVYGMPDERWGQRVCAAIVGDVDIDELQDWLRPRLSGYKRPKEVHIITGLPHTASGKTKRMSVAQVVAEQVATDQ
ncbi:MAG: AMP-dependent synthetase, partial [Actinobacteria bacterium]|nr:AMP-dependent synthetase [Actinomycetota bacterium]